MKNMFLGLLFSLLTFSLNQKKENYFLISQDTKLLKSIARGKVIYKDMCITCHLPNGKGVEKIYPPLAKSDFLMNKRDASIRAIKFGIEGKIVVNGVTYNTRMASTGLYDDEVADVMNYITNSWGNKNDKIITLEEVKGITENKKE